MIIFFPHFFFFLVSSFDFVLYRIFRSAFLLAHLVKYFYLFFSALPPPPPPPLSFLLILPVVQFDVCFSLLALFFFSCFFLFIGTGMDWI